SPDRAPRGLRPFAYSSFVGWVEVEDRYPSTAHVARWAMGFAALNPSYESLSVVIRPVPLRDPVLVQRHELLEVRYPDFHLVGIESLRIDRRPLERAQIALLLVHEGLAFDRQAPVEIEPCGVRMRRRLRNAGRVGGDGHALGRKDHLERGPVAL